MLLVAILTAVSSTTMILKFSLQEQTAGALPLLKEKGQRVPEFADDVFVLRFSYAADMPSRPRFTGKDRSIPIEDHTVAESEEIVCVRYVATSRPEAGCIDLQGAGI